MVQKTRASSSTESPKVESISDESISKHGRTLVFISHDSRDGDLAEAFANLLTDVSGGTLKSFRSSDKKGVSGIEFGTEWYKAIMSQLGDATDVVALLTEHSTNRPWILYEAGVAKGKLDTNVLGVAVGVPLENVSIGPFGQFQNCSDDEDSLTKLVIQLLRRNPDASPREEAVHVQVRVFRDKVKTLFSSKGKTTTPSETDESNIAKLFEEVKVMVRELPERVDDRVRVATKRSTLKPMRRFLPMQIEELLFELGMQEKPQEQAIAWLLLISLFRDDIPWLYEIGLEIYHAFREGDSKKLEKGRMELISILKVSSRSPSFRDFIRSGDEEIYYMMKKMPEILERFIMRSSIHLQPKVLKFKTLEDNELK